MRDLDAERIVLTTSTSEGYSFVFRLLCNAGDELLVPKPSYPLFEFLADLQDVKLVPYPLIYDHGWQMDFPSMEKAVTARTRGVVVVHPNNPTGSYVSAGEMKLLNAFCKEHGLAVIADEVFLDYGLRTARGEGGNSRSLHALTDRLPPIPSLSRDDNAGDDSDDTSGDRRDGRSRAQASFAGNRDVLSFTLKRAVEDFGASADESGLGGDERAGGCGCAAMGRLEVIADTYLSMNAPIQWAMPALLDQSKNIQKQLHGAGDRKSCGARSAAGGTEGLRAAARRWRMVRGAARSGDAV